MMGLSTRLLILTRRQSDGCESEAAGEASERNPGACSCASQGALVLLSSTWLDTVSSNLDTQRRQTVATEMI
jgi:hypothetical protein